MRTKKAIEILEQWIKDDKKILGDDTESDFAKFCIEKSEAIKTVLNRVKKPVTIADYIRSLDDELLGTFLFYLCQEHPWLCHGMNWHTYVKQKYAVIYWKY